MEICCSKFREILPLRVTSSLTFNQQKEIVTKLNNYDTQIILRVG